MVWRPRYYILDERDQVVPVEDVLEWGRWFEANTDRRRVAQDMDEGDGSDGVHVSTVFLGLDHNYYDEGPPLIFETMVFGGPLDGAQERYSTMAEALKGHQDMCVRVRLAR